MLLVLSALACCAAHEPSVAIIPLVYVITATSLDAASRWNWMRHRKIHTAPSPPPGVKERVLALFLLQSALDLCFGARRDGSLGDVEGPRRLLWSIARLCAAALVLDTYQYWSHRAAHAIPLLYARIHKMHHALRTPTPWGALYNSFLECVLIDIASFEVAKRVAGLSSLESVVLGAVATAKTVMDHGEYATPGLANDATYHAAHHAAGVGNFEQPFFTIWDDLMGTRLPGT